MTTIWDAPLPLYVGAAMLIACGLLWLRNRNHPTKRHPGPLLGYAGTGLITGYLLAMPPW